MSESGDVDPNATSTGEDVDFMCTLDETDPTGRYDAAMWLRKRVGVVVARDLPAEPSEEDCRQGLKSGMILCKVLNKIKPGAVPKVVNAPSPVLTTPDSEALAAYLQNIKSFLVAVEDLGLPTFEPSDLEPGGDFLRVVNTVLAMRAYNDFRAKIGDGSRKFSWSSPGGEYSRRKSAAVMSGMSINSEYSWGTEDQDDDVTDPADECDMGPLYSIVSDLLMDREEEDIPIIVENILKKLKEEFESRLAEETKKLSGEDESEESSEDEAAREEEERIQKEKELQAELERARKLQQQEEERAAREEEERIQREKELEAERERIRKQQEEAERAAREEQERIRKEQERIRKQQEEAERAAKEAERAAKEAERAAKEEQERIQREQELARQQETEQEQERIEREKRRQEEKEKAKQKRREEKKAAKEQARLNKEKEKEMKKAEKNAAKSEKQAAKEEKKALKEQERLNKEKEKEMAKKQREEDKAAREQDRIKREIEREHAKKVQEERKAKKEEERIKREKELQALQEKARQGEAASLEKEKELLALQEKARKEAERERREEEERARLDEERERQEEEERAKLEEIERQEEEERLREKEERERQEEEERLKLEEERERQEEEERDRLEAERERQEEEERIRKEEELARQEEEEEKARKEEEERAEKEKERLEKEEELREQEERARKQDDYKKRMSLYTALNANTAKKQGLVERQEKDLQELRGIVATAKTEVHSWQDSCKDEAEQLGGNVRTLCQAAAGYNKVLDENRKLYNQVQDLKGSIRVYCRLKPFPPGQENNPTTVDYTDEETVVLLNSKGAKETRKASMFNKVFGPASTQEEVFTETQPLIRSVLDGFNVCIFAYGQTGAGKTYTLTGPEDLNEETMGVNLRALNDLFLIAEERHDLMAYTISINILEIYNEEIRDLLVTDGSNKIIEISSSKKGINVPDATLVTVASTDEVINQIKLSRKNREGNDHSSEAHTFLTAHVFGKDLTSGSTVKGCMHLVDLAGSEKVQDSLSSLGDILVALATKAKNVPYKSCKLTNLIQDAIGAQAKILMFVQVITDVDEIQESLNTFKFIERFSTVEGGCGKTAEVRDLKEQFSYLKSALAKVGGGQPLQPPDLSASSGAGGDDSGSKVEEAPKAAAPAAAAASKAAPAAAAGKKPAAAAAAPKAAAAKPAAAAAAKKKGK